MRYYIYHLIININNTNPNKKYFKIIICIYNFIIIIKKHIPNTKYQITYKKYAK